MEVAQCFCILGIVIGNASVITLVGVGRGAQNLAENQLSNLGANVLFVVPGNNDTRRRGVAFPKNLVLKDAFAIEQQVPTVKRVAPQITSNEVILIRFIYAMNHMLYISLRIKEIML